MSIQIFFGKECLEVFCSKYFKDKKVITDNWTAESLFRVEDIQWNVSAIISQFNISQENKQIHWWNEDIWINKTWNDPISETLFHFIMLKCCIIYHNYKQDDAISINKQTVYLYDIQINTCANCRCMYFRLRDSRGTLDHITFIKVV